MDEQPRAGRKPMSPRARRWLPVIVAVAALTPVVLVGGGGFVALGTGHPFLAGAFVGVVVYALSIGTAWIGVGAWAMRRELRVRKEAVTGIRADGPD